MEHLITTISLWVNSNILKQGTPEKCPKAHRKYTKNA